MPPSEDEASLDDDEFVVPEDPVEQKCFQRRLMATTNSLKKKQQQLRADQDLLADRWTEVSRPKSMNSNAPPKSSPSAGVSGAALNPATARMEIPAQEIIAPRKVPKTTPSSTIQRRTRQKQALTRGRQTKRSRMIITYIPPETRQASTTTNLLCQRIPSSKSVFNAGL